MQLNTLQCRERDKFLGLTYNELFEKTWKKFCGNLEDHEFIHFNQAMNIRIYSKEHMKIEMKRRKMLPFDTCEELAENWDKRNPQKKMDEISPKAQEILASLKLSADSKGRIRMGGRAIEALKEIGAINNPAEFRGFSGGFS